MERTLQDHLSNSDIIYESSKYLDKEKGISSPDPYFKQKVDPDPNPNSKQGTKGGTDQTAKLTKQQASQPVDLLFG